MHDPNFNETYCFSRKEKSNRKKQERKEREYKERMRAFKINKTPHDDDDYYEDDDAYWL